MIKVTGIIVPGKKQGARLGFPTANLRIKDKTGSGVYSGYVIISGIKYRAAIFIPEKKDILEAHILNFSEDLYGKEVEVFIDKKIREVGFFKNDEDLKKQIKKDIEEIKNL